MGMDEHTAPQEKSVLHLPERELSSAAPASLLPEAAKHRGQINSYQCFFSPSNHFLFLVPLDRKLPFSICTSCAKPWLQLHHLNSACNLSNKNIAPKEL